MLKEIKNKLKHSWVNARYALSRIADFPLVVPEFIQINITTRCNLRCQICTTYKTPSLPQEELCGEEIKRLACEAGSLGIKRIVISGGEPFLRSDIFEIIAFIKANTNLDVIITSNGTLIDQVAAEKIIGAKTNHIQISLDGASEEVHDLIRGKGSFAKTMSGIKALNGIRQHRLSLGLSFTVTKANYKEIPSFLTLGKDLDVDHMLFIPLIEDNTYKHDKQGIKAIFSEQENKEFDSILGEVEKFRLKYSRPNITNFENLSLYKSYYSGRLDSLHWLCYAGFHWIQVNHNGDVQMCEWGYGNIKGRTLKEAWYSNSARIARKKIKKCRKLCLQPCMSRPS